MYMCARGIHFASFYDCCICAIFVFYFETVPTLCYFCILFWNCSDIVLILYLILKLFRQCAIFVLHFMPFLYYTISGSFWYSGFLSRWKEELLQVHRFYPSHGWNEVQGERWTGGTRGNCRGRKSLFLVGCQLQRLHQVLG